MKNFNQPYAVSVGHDTAAEIAADILIAGGNAIDAGVAASIALTVLHSEQVQLGGVAPMLVHSAKDKRTYSIEGAGRWPARTERAFFEAKHRGRIPQGILRTVVPAAPDAWLTALARFGTMGFADLAEPAFRLAKEGFPAHQDLVLCTTEFEQFYCTNPENARIWLPDGAPVKLGMPFIQPALAATLGAMIDADRKSAKTEGRLGGLDAVRDLFYEGDIADVMIRHVSELGGWMTHADLAAHKTPVVPATSAEVFGGTLFTGGPWSQGPALSQVLQIIEQFPMERLNTQSAATQHTIIEALKLALADREAFYGDPDFIDTPINHLLSQSYARERSQLIRDDRAFEGLPLPGDISTRKTPRTALQPNDGNAGASLDTSIAAIIDGEGNIFAATPSDFSADAPVVPELGFVLSTRGSQSFVAEDHPASIRPGKRPRVSACPIIMETRDGGHIAGGGPGADLQLQAMAQVLIGHLAGGLSLDAAVATPRFFTHSAPYSAEPHFSFPGKVTVEDAISEENFNTLTSLGHKTVRGTATGVSRPSICLVSKNKSRSVFDAVGDPRRASGQRLCNPAADQTCS